MRLNPVFVFIIILLAISGCAQESEDRQKPNILLIVVDDLGYADMSFLEASPDDVSTPNIDRIAENGTYLSNAYASSPICSPSRMSIMTGVYHQRFGTFWYGGKGIHRAEYQTIAELLKGDGYATGYVGKVHYGSNDADTTNRNFPLNHGFDYYMGHTSARKHYLKHKDTLEEAFIRAKRIHERTIGQTLKQQSLWENTGKIDTMAFSTQLFGQYARQFMERNKEEPFFLQLSFNAVHNFTHQLPEDYLEKHNLEGYYDWDPSEEPYMEWYRRGRRPNNPEGRAHYIGQLHFLDQQIGKVLDYLNTNGLTEETLVVFISDNGGSTPIYANNAPLRGSKYTLHEGGIRVPMMFSLPGKIAEDTIVNNMVSGMDILPTVCALTGRNIPENIDGLNLLPLLQGMDTSIAHDQLVWDTQKEVAVRTDKWKYHRVKDASHAENEVFILEEGDHLYNLQKDIGESEDLKEDYIEQLSKMKQIHENWKEDL